MIKTWLDHAGLLGNLPQWVSAICTVGALGYAVYGVNKAIPYFENMNLREANAQLQLSNRTLEGQISAQREALNIIEQAFRLAKLVKACSDSQTFIRTLFTGHYRAELRYGGLIVNSDPASEKMWKDAEESALPVSYLLEALLAEGTLNWLSEDDRNAISSSWLNVAQLMGSALNIEFVPKFANGRPTVSKSNEDLDRISKTVRDLEVALNDACRVLIPPNQ